MTIAWQFKVLPLLVALVWVFAPGRTVAEPMEAGEYVQIKSEQLLAIINREKVHYREDPERFIEAIRAELLPLLDMRVAVRKVMGSHYRQATSGQKKRFGERFRDSLIEAFAKAIAEFEFESIDVTSSQQKKGSRQAVVEMRIKTRSSEVSLVYYLYLARSGDWKLYNMRLDGADLTSAYVGQFTSRMAAYNDIDRVIDSWGG